MALLKFHLGGRIIQKYFKSFILACREKQNIKNVKKINLEKNKINNKQVRNRITKSGWAAQSFRAR